MKAIFFLLLFTGVLSAQIAPPENFKWLPIQIGQHQYLPLDQVKKFYDFGKMQVQDDGKTLSLTNRTVEAIFPTENHAAYFNGVKFWLAHPIVKKDDSYYVSQFDLTALMDPILRPKFIKNAGKFDTVVLDAGHGGNDQGSANEEAQHTLKLAKKLKPLLEEKGYKVIMTREEDIFVSLGDRVRMANAHKNAIFVSLHFNSGNRNAQGFETYILSRRVPGKNTHAASVALATAVHSRAILSLGKGHIKDRGIRSAKFNVLNGCKHPSILIEAGFLTHKEEAAMVTADDFQELLIKSIVKGIHEYRAAVTK
ncbi:MAG: N-acetylmuramoyl-L-alanine amidase [Akkermansiaceae bacterium]|nr:N-acetylmuramoyl-L-alanine amidase [Akkermansiaceae bacterium]